jgi:hypothetical protein
VATLAALPTSVWMRMYAVTTSTDDLLASCHRCALERRVPRGWWHAAAGQANTSVQGESIGGSCSELGLAAAGDMNPTRLSHGGTDASTVTAPDLHAPTGSITLVIVGERHPTWIAFRAIREAPAVNGSPRNTVRAGGDRRVCGR